jgi:hypothetical protein
MPLLQWLLWNLQALSDVQAGVVSLAHTTRCSQPNRDTERQRSRQQVTQAAAAAADGHSVSRCHVVCCTFVAPAAAAAAATPPAAPAPAAAAA